MKHFKPSFGLNTIGLRTLFAIGTMLFAVQPTHAQFNKNKFGKNRVQYKDKEWNYISTMNFDIYFYDGGYDVAKLAAQFAEEDFDRITDMVGFSPYNKTKILIYNSIIDLQQSNIGIYYQGYSVGGQTRFIHSEVEVAFSGLKAEFKEELSLSISDILIFEMMYGGSLKDIFRNSYLLNLPEWFMSGASSYIANGWDEEMDDYIRDMFSQKRIKKVSNLKGEEARLVGQSIWNYMAEEYGRSNIANVLNLIRIVRNEENSIQNTLGISYKSFMKGWEEYYRKQNKVIAESHIDPTEDQIFKKNRKKFIFNDMTHSPSGRYIAYTTNTKGRWKVKVYDTKKDKTKKVLTGGYKLINQQIDKNAPLLAWRDKAELGIFAPHNGRMHLWFYELGKKQGRKRKEKRVFRSFSNIRGFDIDPSGNYLALSAEWRGRNNLYYYDYRQRKLTQLTNDIYDDINPRFMPGRDKKIVFSSNRVTDTLDVIRGYVADDIKDNFNVFVYDFDNAQVLRRVTNTLSKDVKPVPISTSEILYLSDQRGISHLYKYNLNDSVSTQVTNYQTGIQNYNLSKNNELMMIMLDDGKDLLYQVKDFNPDKPIFTTKTYRQQLNDLRYVQEMKRKREIEARRKKLEEQKLIKQQEQDRLIEKIKKATQEAQDSLKAIQDSTLTNLPDSLQQNQAVAVPDSLGAVSGSDSTDVNEIIIEQPTPVADSTTTAQGGDEIDTDDYQFDTFSKNRRSKFLEKYREKVAQQKGGKEEQDESGEMVEISKSRPYERMFALDNVTTSLEIDPLRGWGLLFDAAMTDVLENHKINAGLFFVTSLNNSNIYAEYEYLKKRFDYRVRYERRNLETATDAFSHRYYINMFEGSVSYPLNITTRVSVEPFFATTRFSDLVINSGRQDEIINYAGFNAEFIFDNSIVIGTNMMHGTRFKARYENYNSLNIGDRSFGKFTLDFRNYQRISRSLVFATRFSYGKFLGKSPKDFVLGGMDNWLFNKTDDGGENNALGVSQGNNSDLLFVDFVTPMRGFNYNKLSGQDYLLINAELRFPPIKFFAKNTINSNFFRNLQLVGFADVGSAWTGISPFNRENALNTVTDEDGNFSWKVSNFKNPFLIGYGAGLRTVLMGYYTKFDVAWGLEDNVVLDPKFYLTLGYDF
ncbi:translocation protein TolB [Flammeovirgaceae bacterium SG7u.111]|nr:translocation protein TolB [Flammeovirgaceae bacterium SG7u.132]WPO35042.1 translocation protein TolB [Flammeovirgaceae bacterium SG7u.111]